MTGPSMSARTGNEVLAFAPSSIGLPKWLFPTGADIETAPTLSNDGSIVYALGENGTVYAINASDRQHRLGP